MILGSFNGKNSEFRADDFTVVTVNTVIWLFDRRRVISLAIEFSSKLKDILGAEFYTVTTPFASILQDMDNAFGDLNVICV